MSNLTNSEKRRGATRGDVTWLVVLVGVAAVIIISIFVGVPTDPLNKG